MLAHAVLSLLVVAGDAAPAPPDPPQPVQVVEATSGPPLRWTAVRGVDGVPLEGTAFYDAVERPDLAERYRERSGVRATARVGGPILAVGSVVGAVALLANDMKSCEQGRAGSCLSLPTTDLLLATFVGFAGVTTGVAIAVWGRHSDPHVVTIDEARALAEDHARRARGEPGLDPARLPPRPAAPPAASLEVHAGPRAVALALRF
jgi:hypothetical protein